MQKIDTLAEVKKESKDLIQITIATAAISGSYFIGSKLLIGDSFYFFDILWRIAIISILLLGKFRPKVGLKQWLILLVVFTVEFLAYKLFTPTFSHTRILISVAFAPLSEEFFFRGWVMNKVDGKVKKIFITCLLFSLYHLKNLNMLSTQALIFQILYSGFLIGPVLALARLKYETLFASLLIHSGNNIFAEVIVTRFFPFITQRKMFTK